MASTEVESGEQPPQGAKQRGAARHAAARAGSAAWRRAGRLLDRLRDRYPELPPAPEGRWPRIAFGLVVALAATFVAVFTAYLFARQNAYMTHAEDLGIMDQALWNTLHGAPLHQTICNIVSDSNCLGDISRLAIHFEPIMFPLSLLYLVAPSPKTLQFVQALVVATGALPAYWIACRRLRSPLAGLVFAVVYLLFPALQAAVIYDFHAVTLSAAFLMFALYFMLTRNNKGLLIACVLAIATKEEVPVDIAMIGLSIALLQRRPKLGFGLVAFAAVWLVMALAVMHAASPLGHSPTAGRYAALGPSPEQAVLYLLTHPAQVLQAHVFEPVHRFYLRGLLSPVGYLPLLSPLTLLIAVPALAINLLSSDPSMYSGLYHYNAEIVPVLVLAAIESVALLNGVATWTAARFASLRLGDLRGRNLRLSSGVSARLAGLRRVPWRLVAPSRMGRAALLVLLAALVLASAREQRDRGYLPVARGFVWPTTTAHEQLAQDFIARIPASASVSAQSDLVPHLSHRRLVYLYPDRAAQADFVLLDVTGNEYPLATAPQTYFADVQALLASGNDHVVAASDGYMLLARGPATSPGVSSAATLPASFYSFMQSTMATVPHHVDASFGPSLRLVGYDVSPSPVLSLNNPYLTVTTYWQVSAPLPGGEHPVLVLTGADGSEDVDTVFPATEWRPMQQWQPGVTYAVRSEPLELTSREAGQLRVGVRVLGPTSGGAESELAATSPTGGGVQVLQHGTVAAFTVEQVTP